MKDEPALKIEIGFGTMRLNGRKKEDESGLDEVRIRGDKPLRRPWTCEVVLNKPEDSGAVLPRVRCARSFDLTDLPAKFRRTLLCYHLISSFLWILTQVRNITCDDLRCFW